jgi:type IV pilus assembly protein PilB
MVTEEQLNAALQLQRTLGCRLGQALIRLGHCTEMELARSLSAQMEVPLVDLDQTPPDPSCISLVPAKVACKYQVVPVRLEFGRLLVAAEDPYDMEMEDALRAVTRLSIIPGIAPTTQIVRYLNRHYSGVAWR